MGAHPVTGVLVLSGTAIAHALEAPPVSDSTVASRRLNALRRWRSPDDPAIDDARRDLAAASLSDHIRRVVDQAPPLTAEQIEQLRGLLPVPGPIDADLGNGESGRATPA